MPPLIRFALALALLTPLPAGAASRNASSLLFEAPALADLPTGTRLIYDLERTAPEPAAAPGPGGPAGPASPETKADASPSRSEVELSILPGEESGSRPVQVQTSADGRRTLAGPFPSLVGNPVLLVFLERDVVEMAKALRGSPYYLRNRIREALGEATLAEPARLSFEGREVEGWRIAVTPFEADRNRDKLREFAAKRYEFALSDAVPGRLLEMRATTRRADGTLLAEERLAFRRSLPPGQEVPR